jgi:hypothetical protein
MSICQTEIFMNLRLQKTNQTLENKWWPLRLFVINTFPISFLYKTKSLFPAQEKGPSRFQCAGEWGQVTLHLALGNMEGAADLPFSYTEKSHKTYCYTHSNICDFYFYLLELCNPSFANFYTVTTHSSISSTLHPTYLAHSYQLKAWAVV